MAVNPAVWFKAEENCGNASRRGTNKLAVRYRVSDILSDMKMVGVREISKNWPEVLEKNAGAEVAITKRGQVVAYLRVLPRKKGQQVELPDFKKRIESRFGKRTLSRKDVLWLDEAMKSAH